jgi:sodium/potassium/calcium exchanger 6
MGSVAIISPIQIQKWVFLRDSLFFSGALGLIVYVTWDKKIDFTESLCLIFYYVLYVAVVLAGDFYERRQKSNSLASDSLLDSDDRNARAPLLLNLELDDHVSILEEDNVYDLQDNSKILQRMKQKLSLLDVVEIVHLATSKHQGTGASYLSEESVARPLLVLSSQVLPCTPSSFYHDNDVAIPSAIARDSNDYLLERAYASKLSAFHLLLPVLSLNGKSLPEQMALILMTPLFFLLRLSVPVISFDVPSKLGAELRVSSLCHAQHFFCALLTLFSFTGSCTIDFLCKYVYSPSICLTPSYFFTEIVSNLKIGLVFILGMSTFVFLLGLLVYSRFEHARNSFSYCWVGFFMSILWIYYIANEVVNVLRVCINSHICWY